MKDNNNIKKNINLTESSSKADCEYPLAPLNREPGPFDKSPDSLIYLKTWLFIGF
jgi:hypothetical protein